MPEHQRAEDPSVTRGEGRLIEAGDEPRRWVVMGASIRMEGHFSAPEITRARSIGPIIGWVLISEVILP
jgi:hypothetical protein